VTKAPTIITKVPAKGHTGSLPSTSLDHHIFMLVASRGNLSFTDPIRCFRDDCSSTVGHWHAVAVVRSSQSRGKPSSCNHGEEICHDPCHAKFVDTSSAFARVSALHAIFELACFAPACVYLALVCAFISLFVLVKKQFLRARVLCLCALFVQACPAPGGQCLPCACVFVTVCLVSSQYAQLQCVP